MSQETPTWKSRTDRPIPHARNPSGPRTPLEIAPRPARNQRRWIKAQPQSTDELVV